jgi:Flp pilus assembly protein TadD
LSRQGKDEEAIEPYRRLFRLKPEFLPVYQRLAVILARQGKSAEAAKLLAGPK